MVTDFSAVPLAHIWPLKSDHCIQNVHPDSHCDIQISLFPLYQHPPFGHSPGSPELSAPMFDSAALSPCPSGGNTAPVPQALSHVLCWGKTDKSGGEGRGNQAHNCWRAVWFGSNLLCNVAWHDQDASANLPRSPCRSNLNLGTPQLFSFFFFPPPPFFFSLFFFLFLFLSPLLFFILTKHQSEHFR